MCHSITTWAIYSSHCKNIVYSISPLCPTNSHIYFPDARSSKPSLIIPLSACSSPLTHATATAALPSATTRDAMAVTSSVYMTSWMTRSSLQVMVWLDRTTRRLTTSLSAPMVSILRRWFSAARSKTASSTFPELSSIMAPTCRSSTRSGPKDWPRSRLCHRLLSFQCFLRLVRIWLLLMVNRDLSTNRLANTWRLDDVWT